MKFLKLTTVPMIFSVMAILGGHVHANPSDQNGELVEIPIDGFISPAEGFEAKNNVEGVAYGYLPNSCYTLSKAKVTLSKDNSKRIMLKQYAVKQKDGVCAQDNSDGSGLAEHLRMRVPFSTDVFIGMLPAGTYKIEYRQISGQGFRTLEVAKATVAGDSFPYANVLNAMTTEVVKPNDDVKVTMSGVFNSSCTTLDRVEQKKVDDVYVLLPILKTTPGVMCLQVLIPFETDINLGKAALGNHLVHIRSMNGRAINRLIQVIQ